MLPKHAYLSESLHLTECLCVRQLYVLSSGSLWIGAVSEVSGAGHMIAFYPQIGCTAF